MGNHANGRRFWRLVVALVALLGIVAAGCGGDDDATSSAPTSDEFAADDAGSSGFETTARQAEPAAEAPAEVAPADAVDDSVAGEQAVQSNASQGETAAEEPEADGGGGNAGSPDTPSQLDPSALGRSIVYVGSIEVTVDDVPLAASQAKTAIAGLGGLLFGEDTQTGDNNRTILQFKVLPADFQEALGRLEGLGELESQQVSADDVTERVVDLQSRISSLEISVDRLRDLLVGATDLEAIAGLEGQLLQRETDLETMRGQLRTLEDQVSLATIFLTLRQTAPPAVLAEAEFEVTFYEGDDGGERCPGLPELEIDEGVDAIVCVQMTNTGTASLAEIELRDDNLGLRPRDFTFVDATADTVLAPDETLTAWAGLTAPANGSSRVRPTAIAVDESGDPTRVGVEFVLTADYSIRFIEDDSLPGFTDGLRSSWDFFRTLVEVIVLVAGALVPFVWVPFVIWGVREWWLRRQARADDKAEESESPQPAAAE